MTALSASGPSRAVPLPATLGALGVVYGDIGTSPLYALKEAARAAARLGLAMGSTAADGSVTLEPVYCLGLCAIAPSAMLDGRVVGRLDQGRLDALLAEAQQ